MFETLPREEIEALIDRDAEFRWLYRRHRELDHKVQEVTTGVVPMEQAALSLIKREKLHTKDRLEQLLRERRGPVH